MRTEPLTPGALQPLIDFVAELWTVDGPRSEMHVGDAYTALLFDAHGDLGKAARLWYDAQGQIAAAAFFSGFTFDMLIRPVATETPLAADMIDWAIAELRRAAPQARSLRVQRRPYTPDRIAFLEGLGFHRMSTGALALGREVQTVSGGDVPDGFTIRSLTAAEVPSRMRAFADAFPTQTASASDYKRLMRCAGYDSTLDVVAIDCAGEVAAFATAWLDRRNAAGLFEPVGTCRRYQRHGLARSLLLEGLRRLGHRGATSAVVRARSENIAAIRCYQSAGFTIVSDIFGFERQISPARDQPEVRSRAEVLPNTPSQNRRFRLR